jgi:hypothetical protein
MKDKLRKRQRRGTYRFSGVRTPNLFFEIVCHEILKGGVGCGSLVLSPGGLWWWRNFRW